MSAIIKMPAVLVTLQESVALFWSERDARERSMLGIGMLAVLLLLVYAILFAPALKGRAQLNKDLPTLRQQGAEMQALAKQALQLNGSAAIQPESVSQESIAASLTARGMKPKNLSVNDGLVRLQLDPVSFSNLLSWIDERQKVSRMTVLDANFIAAPQLDTVNATLTLKQQGNGENDQ